MEIFRVPTERKAHHCPVADTRNDVGHGVEDFDLCHPCEVLATVHQRMTLRTATVRRESFFHGQLSFLNNIWYESPDCLGKIGSDDGCLIWGTLLEFVHHMVKLEALVALKT